MRVPFKMSAHLFFVIAPPTHQQRSISLSFMPFIRISPARENDWRVQAVISFFPHGYCCRMLRFRLCISCETSMSSNRIYIQLFISNVHNVRFIRIKSNCVCAPDREDDEVDDGDTFLVKMFTSMGNRNENARVRQHFH